MRVVAWTTGCMWRCQYCHNPDTWTLTNGIPVSVVKAAEELGKYRHGLKTMSGGFTLNGGEPLMQSRFAAMVATLVGFLGGQSVLRLATDDLLGVVSGIAGNPAILVYANKMQPSDRIDAAYAAVFPSMTIFKILCVQVTLGLLR